MDPLSTVSLVGNIIQSVDFGSKLISKSVELYLSTEGALDENLDTETATKHIKDLNEMLKNGAKSTGDTTLKDPCEACDKVARELLEALDKVKVKGKNEKWKSIRKALWSVWSKGHIEELEQPLARLRAELNLHLVVDLREQISRFRLEQSDRLKDVDLTTKSIIDAVVKKEDVFRAAYGSQISLMKTLQGETLSSIENASRKIVLKIRQRELERCQEPPKKSIWFVPFTRNDRFVGRSSQLGELKAKLFVDGYCPKVAVYGLGGVGKTQIVLELAYQTRDTSPDCSVFWVAATSAETVQKEYQAIGRRLQIPGSEKEGEDVKEACVRLLKPGRCWPVAPNPGQRGRYRYVDRKDWHGDQDTRPSNRLSSKERQRINSFYHTNSESSSEVCWVLK